MLLFWQVLVPEKGHFDAYEPVALLPCARRCALGQISQQQPVVRP